MISIDVNQVAECYENQLQQEQILPSFPLAPIEENEEFEQTENTIISTPHESSQVSTPAVCDAPQIRNIVDAQASVVCKKRKRAQPDTFEQGHGNPERRSHRQVAAQKATKKADEAMKKAKELEKKQSYDERVIVEGVSKLKLRRLKE